MQFFVVVGSHRKVSQSAKVGRWVETLIKTHDPGAMVETLDLGINPLPLWDEGVWDKKEPWPSIWKPISEKLKKSEALVVISPEYSGMSPAALKNFFLLCGPHDVGHKPALLIGVSSGLGGSYPVAELRASSYKNTRICYIPDHVVVKKAEGVLNGPTPVSPEDEFIRKRLNYSVQLLCEYAKAFVKIRESGVIDHKSFANGL